MSKQLSAERIQTAARSLRGFQLMAMAWLATTSALFVGLLTVGVESAAGSGFTVVAIEPAYETAELAFEANDYPTGLYGGMSWSLADVRVVLRTDDPFSRPVIIVEAIATNTTDAVLRVRETDLAVVWPDGTRHYVDRLEQSEASQFIPVAPGATTPVTAVFKPVSNQDPRLPELALEIGEPNRIPLSFPLAGPLPPATFPIEAEIADEPVVIADTDNPGRSLVVTPRSSQVDINEGPYRAAIGNRLNLVEVSVQRSADTDDAAYLQTEFWELQTGSERSNPVRVVKQGEARVGEDEVRLLFVLRADAELDVSLTAAANTDEPVVFPIEVPSFG